MVTLTATDTGLTLDRSLIDQNLDSMLPAEDDPVCRAMGYAVLGTGQRLRPLLALRVARLLEGREDTTLRLCCALEFLHCASLIVDDLPCMDNDAMRRNRPAVHVQFGEANATLAAFALVSLAARAAASEPVFQRKLLETLDCKSLIGGQSLDLQLSGSSRERNRSYVTSLKTVPLFQLAIHAACLPGCGSRSDREQLLQFGREFGIAYQTADDYLDGEIDDLSQVTAQFTRAEACLASFGSRAAGLQAMLDYLNAKVWEDGRSRR